MHNENYESNQYSFAFWKLKNVHGKRIIGKVAEGIDTIQSTSKLIIQNPTTCEARDVMVRSSRFQVQKSMICRQLLRTNLCTTPIYLSQTVNKTGQKSHYGGSNEN